MFSKKNKHWNVCYVTTTHMNGFWQEHSLGETDGNALMKAAMIFSRVQFSGRSDDFSLARLFSELCSRPKNRAPGTRGLSHGDAEEPLVFWLFVGVSQPQRTCLRAQKHTLFSMLISRLIHNKAIRASRLMNSLRPTGMSFLNWPRFICVNRGDEEEHDCYSYFCQTLIRLRNTNWVSNWTEMELNVCIGWEGFSGRKKDF